MKKTVWIICFLLVAATALAGCSSAPAKQPSSAPSANESPGANPPSASTAPGQSAPATPPASSSDKASGASPAGGASQTDTHPLPGKLLIADRGNSRLLIVTADKHIIWSMDLNNSGPKNANSLGADDAFVTPDGKHIIINEEDNQMLGIIDIATKKIVWSYGHAGVRGSKPGYLNTPDDAYQLPDGTVTVADIKNQRIVFISPDGRVIKQYGTTGLRRHNPPQSFAAPNGDTPLPDGGMLVTEIGGSYADRLDKNGKLVYSVHFKDIAYPSDTQLLANGNLLVVDYSTPGKVEEVSPKGEVVWKYFVPSGPGMLSKPSLGIPLPNGNVAVNDDYNHRVVVIDPTTNRIVWQYGQTGKPGTGPNQLNVPDGMDFLPDSWQLPKS